MSESSEKSRIEAFSDGVFAIAITLLVLELKVPQADDPKTLWQEILRLWPSLVALTLSFGSILVMWMNHHNMFRMIDKVSRSMMFANGFLLFTVIIIPFPTALLAEYLRSEARQPAVVVFCASSVLNNVGFNLLWNSMLKPVYLVKPEFKRDSILRLTRSVRGGLIVYTIAALVAIWSPIMALIINFSLWVLWISMSLRERF